VDYTYGMGLVPHYEKDLIYNYYGTKKTLGYLYSRAKAGGFWRWSTDAQAGAGYPGGSARPYASIVINGATKSVSDNSKKGIEWTDEEETATSWKNYSVVFKIHCWY
jgi:hypothetical protein